MPIVKNCCKCIGLRKAVITIGCIELVCEIIGLLVMATVKMKLKIISEELSNAISMILGLLFYGFCIVVSIFLIVGGVKMRRWYILPWLILSMVLKSGFLLTAFITGVMYIVDGSPASGVAVIILSLFWFGFFLYLWIVVYSYFDELKTKPPTGRA